MTTVGIDIEQFVRDPYGSGIQRVLQYLAREWPDDLARGLFVVPWRGENLLLDPAVAARLINIAFESRIDDLRIPIHSELEHIRNRTQRVSDVDLPSKFDAWLLPEVSYLPSVLSRLEAMKDFMPTVMIGYDALPMTEPGNYRFPPGVAANASEYFRLLATTDALVCISEYSRQAIISRLRRNPELITRVAHPGGDHVDAGKEVPGHSGGPTHFLRVGTMEERKMPLEILRAFRDARAAGADARLTYVGGRSSSYERINDEIAAAEDEDIGFTWISNASDEVVNHLISECDALMCFGTEGYGIPVLEAIRRRKPVLYGGTQPAAELMVDSGAVDCGEPSQSSIKRVFLEYSQPSVTAKMGKSCRPEDVPSWKSFARSVVEAATAIS